MGYLVTILPLTERPFIAKSAKSNSHFSFLIELLCLNWIVTISDSPFGFDEKCKTLVLTCCDVRL